MHHQATALPIAPSSAAPASAGRGTPSAQLCSRLADVIHEQVLQSLGLCLLQAELCRRMWNSGQEQHALAELDGVSRELESAVDVLRQVTADLLSAAESSALAS